MKKKTVSVISPPIWNPANKESWHLEFEEEPINDDRWTCIVTAMIPAQPEDDECIQIFTESVAKGSRKSIKVIRMAQIIKIFNEKETIDKDNKSKVKTVSKSDKSVTTNASKLNPPRPKTPPILSLASKYATFTETECKMPVDLMAAVLKHLILSIKEENILRMKFDAVKERKMRENSIRSNFIKSKKPFETKITKENDGIGKNENYKPEFVNDEPFLGPDVYIVLVDFYDPFYFSELRKINVPFKALLKISNFKETMQANSQISFTFKPETIAKKENLISGFWRVLEENCLTLERTTHFKDFLFMQYRPQFSKMIESKQLIRDSIFDELSWMLYSVFVVYRQHQTYLQETHVQRMIVSLEPLNLSKCRVYNKLCDSLVTGVSGSVLLILYAMVEQVVAGVPPTESLTLEYEPEESDYFRRNLNSNGESRVVNETSKIKNLEVVTPCLACREKSIAPVLICPNLSEESVQDGNESKNGESRSTPNNYSNEGIKDLTGAGEETPRQESLISNFSVNQSDSEDEIEIYVDKKETSIRPSVTLCLYGDKLALYNSHCDPKLIDLDAVCMRFLERTEIPQLWLKYPVLVKESRIFYNFHFQRLLQTTQDTEDLLKVKIFFTLLMKQIWVTKSYLYRGEEENLSQLISTPSREKFKKFSKVKFDNLGIVRQERRQEKIFSSFFFRLFPIASTRKKVTMKAKKTSEKEEKRKESLIKMEPTNVRKATSLRQMSLVSHRKSGSCFSYFFRASDSTNASNSINQTSTEKEIDTLQSLLESYEISSLSEFQTLNSGDDCINMINNFNFFEKLEPRRMVQRLLEAQEEFSTTQCSYFAPTDTLMILLHNDCDHRGIFFTSGYGALMTPVSLRDFYNHVYLEIKDWLAIEKDRYMKFVAEAEEKAKDLKNKQNEQYLSKLQKEFEAMNEIEKEKFLNANLPNGQFDCLSQSEIREDELADLPIKPRPQHPQKVSFLATKFLDVRVETERKVCELYSKDGTEINVIIDSWLYEPTRLLTLSIKQSRLRFYHHQWLMEEQRDTAFTLRTSTDIIFAFYKKHQEEIDQINPKYQVRISWPTGLMLQNIINEQGGTYIKQYYIKVYKRRRNLDKERYRCFLKCGQVLIFNENDEVEVLCPSGTKHILKNSANSTSDKVNSSIGFGRIQTTTTTGQIWERKYRVNHFQNKRKLIGASKIYIGEDSKTQEIYYRRDDGLCCMLWPNGKLVTNFPDGTKITSTPDFESEEVMIEWTEEEKLYFENLETSYREEISEAKPKSKTILKQHSPDSIPAFSNSNIENNSAFKDEGFVSISLSYLMEHPQYSSVYWDFKSSEIDIKMPNRLSIKIYPEGNYLVNQEKNYLAVNDDSAELYSPCSDCLEKSSATIYFDSKNLLCKFVDLSKSEFHINRNGDISYSENSPADHLEGDKRGTEKSRNFFCKSDHLKPISENQRCFALERNLSGIEFLHSESLAHYCHELPQDTYFDLHSKNSTESILTHIFSSPFNTAEYENWIMDYEDKDDSMPTNLKKVDLKELGGKDNWQKLFKYPFSKTHLGESENEVKISNGRLHKVPKIIVTRIVKCLSKNPRAVIDEVKDYVSNYQKKAHGITTICKRYKRTENDNLKQMEKIIIPPKIYWWTMCSDTSTEIDIHNAGHYTNFMHEFNATFRNPIENALQCKHNLNSFSISSNTVPIYEEIESPEE